MRWEALKFETRKFFIHYLIFTTREGKAKRIILENKIKVIYKQKLNF